MIYLGADHGGFELKEKIMSFLKNNHYQFKDLGNLVFDKDDDYPKYAFAVAERVGMEDNPAKSWNERAKGILLCRSSGGVIIAANKVKNIRAVSVFDIKSAKHAREHNDANIIALSGDWTSDEDAFLIIKEWLSTEFSKDGRHMRRISQIKEYEMKR